MDSRASIREPCCKKKPVLYEGTRLYQLGDDFLLFIYYFFLFMSCLLLILFSIASFLFISFLTFSNRSGPCFFLITTVDLAYLWMVVLGIPVNFKAIVLSDINDKWCKEPNRSIDVHLLIQEKYCLNK